MAYYNNVVRFSVEDVATLPEFDGMSAMQIIKRENDQTVAKYLYGMGMDTAQGMWVQACKHRPLLNKQPTINYTFLGYERIDDDWLHNSHCSIESRINAQEDRGLRGDMMNASKTSRGVEILEANKKRSNGYTEVVPEDEDMKQTISMIQSLQHAQVNIRGPLDEKEDVLRTWDNGFTKVEVFQ